MKGIATKLEVCHQPLPVLAGRNEESSIKKWLHITYITKNTIKAFLNLCVN